MLSLFTAACFVLPEAEPLELHSQVEPGKEKTSNETLYIKALRKSCKVFNPIQYYLSGIYCEKLLIQDADSN
jgi:hypothetical protein